MLESDNTSLTPKEMERAREKESRIKRTALRMVSDLPDPQRSEARERIFKELDLWHAETYFFMHAIVVKSIRSFVVSFLHHNGSNGLGVKEIVKLVSGR